MSATTPDEDGDLTADLRALLDSMEDGSRRQVGAFCSRWHEWFRGWLETFPDRGDDPEEPKPRPEDHGTTWEEVLAHESLKKPGENRCLTQEEIDSLLDGIDDEDHPARRPPDGVPEPANDTRYQAPDEDERSMEDILYSMRRILHLDPLLDPVRAPFSEAELGDLRKIAHVKGPQAMETLGDECDEDGDPAGALKYWIVAIEETRQEPEPGIARKVARKLQTGDGIRRDMGTTLEWYEHAAGKFKVEDALRSAEFLREGADDAKWREIAASWYKHALTLGNLVARHRFASFLVEYEGLDPMAPEVIRLLTIAAEYCLAPAQYDLGCLLRNASDGRGTREEGLRWIRRAAAQRFGPALEELEIALQDAGRITSPTDPIANHEVERFDDIGNLAMAGVRLLRQRVPYDLLARAMKVAPYEVRWNLRRAVSEPEWTYLVTESLANLVPLEDVLKAQAEVVARLAGISHP